MKNSTHTSTSDKPAAAMPFTDPIAVARALQPLWEKAGPLLSRIYELINEKCSDTEEPIDPLNLREAWAEYLNYALAQPEKTLVRQFLCGSQLMGLWQDYAFKSLGSTQKAASNLTPEKDDRRFSAAEWNTHPLFSYLKQAYLLVSRHLLESLQDFDLESDIRDRLDFALRQYISALSPTNFLFTNPEVLRTTIETGGENLIHGLENLIADLERGDGELHISMTDYTAFEVGRNLATTPGSVIYRNELMELIHYHPTTDTIFSEPLLIIPPWINKYYILDLGAQKSFVKWLTDQGHNVYMISWVNPNAAMGAIEFTDYLDKGFFAALEQVEKSNQATSVNTIGYCIGGTLLSMALSHLRSIEQQKRVKTASFLTTLIDFQDAGELKLFTTEPQIELVELQMKHHGGILPAKILKSTFSLLRANDLIWSFVINNYLIGKQPFPFDLLFWNDDSTNLPAKMHSYYLRKMYLENRLKDKGGLYYKDYPIDISAVETPAYFLSCKEDHIAPWKATYSGMQLFKGAKKFVLSASGHIAGVVNPPFKEKYCFWECDDTNDTSESWSKKGRETKGSWWPNWQTWIEGYNTSSKIPAPKPIKGLCPAPGTYVKA